MDMDFAANSVLLEYVRDEINKAKGTIDGLRKDIYAGINDLGEFWEGNSFNTFHDKCLSYEPSIYMLIELLNAYSEQLNETSKETDKLVTSVINALNE